VRRSAALLRKVPEAIGIGTHLARYLIATLSRPNMTIFQASRLAVYVIEQAKNCASSSFNRTSFRHRYLWRMLLASFFMRPIH
jgi:hypothetical protein